MVVFLDEICEIGLFIIHICWRSMLWPGLAAMLQLGFLNCNFISISLVRLQEINILTITLDVS